MLFNSYSFILFFIFVTTSYYLLPFRYRWLFLLLASCYFYMAFIPKYIVILGATILVNYFGGIGLDHVKHTQKRALLFTVLVILNISTLGFFKYFNFFAENVNTLAHFLHWNYSLSFLSIVLPLGLSFHTFQSLSYIIEVYRNAQKAEKNIIIFSLYVMYYPQLVAGPIERPQNLLPQFHKNHTFSVDEVSYGLKLILWGFFKKTVVADSLAVVVDSVYSNPQGFNGPTLIMVMVLFAIQLYCDFSGYSDIAIGTSRVMGIKLMANFRQPYFSTSIVEFWKRWHISLSSWLRDYLYYPLARISRKPKKIYFHISTVITFLLSGLWHGASWNYVVWGGIFGVYIISGELIDNLVRPYRYLFSCITTKVKKLFSVFLTFFLVCFALIFFRANSLEQAFYISTHLHVGLYDFIVNSYNYHTWRNLFMLYDIGGLVKYDISIGLVGSLFVLLYDLQETKVPFWETLQQKPWYVRWSVYYTLILLVFTFGKIGSQHFIYFQF